MSPIELPRPVATPRPGVRAPVAAFLILFALFFCACKGKTPPKPGGVGIGAGPQGTSAGDSDQASRATAEAAAVDRLTENFARVHFDFDSARLTVEGAALLDENARILARYPALVVEIQGHADARGATGYNLALGSTRADAVRTRLMVRGIAAERLPTVTFGEEQPRAVGDQDAAHAINRRVEFRVVRGGTPGVTGSTS